MYVKMSRRIKFGLFAVGKVDKKHLVHRGGVWD